MCPALRLLSLSLLLALPLFVGCKKNDAQAGLEGKDSGSPAAPDGPKEVPTGPIQIPEDAPVGPEARAKIQELVEIFRPIDLTLTSDHFDRQIMEQREIFRELVAGEPEFGWAALHAYTQAKEEPYLVRRALLWVGGKASPKESEDLLATMVEEYRVPIEDRTEAALILAETAPQRYLDIVRPYLERERRATKTMPDDEFLVDGWVNACIELGESPIPMLADVATNLLIMPNARYRAAKRMREFPNEIIGQRALETCLVESTGDHYLRIMAAQSLIELLPRESACEMFRMTLARETTLEFRAYLENTIQKNCR